MGGDTHGSTRRVIGTGVRRRLTVVECILRSFVDFRFPVHPGGNQTAACQKAIVLNMSLLDTAKQR